MNKRIRFFVIVFIPLFIFACHRGGTGQIHVADDTYMPKQVIDSPYKARVADVFNDTHKVSDVDLIGSLWNGIQDSLRNRGMLWTPQNGGEPYTLEGHIIDFKKGGIPDRLLPRLGDTVLVVRVELGQNGRHLATIESKRKITFGKHSLARSAWQKVFEEVSEDVVNQAVKKFQH